MYMNSQLKQCQNKGKSKYCMGDFEITPDDFTFYDKMKVPPPTFCPECRFQRKAMWRNDLSLYNTTCDLCFKNVVTMYSPDSGLKIFCNKCWYSDNWDPYEYGQDFDFTKPFFTQFNELMKKVPHIALVNDDTIASVNCEYTGDCWFAKDCYMVFCAWKIENIMYSYFVLGGKDMMDCMYVRDTSEKMYECINCERCYNLKYSELCDSCIDSLFLYDCKNCSNCFLSCGLRNKQYCFKNQQYTKEEYYKIVEEYRLDTYSGVEKALNEFRDFILVYPRRYAQIYKTVNSTGDYLTNSKNSHHCFFANNTENSKYIRHGGNNVDSYDLITTGEQSECYEGIVLDHSNHNFFGMFSVKSQDIEYTMHCPSSKKLFGCVGIKKGEYSVLNKKYSKDEYFALIEKIKEHMIKMPYINPYGHVYRYGEFFPPEFSHFGYNETSANEFFPLSKTNAVNSGFNWQDNTQKTTGKETISDIPNSIHDIDESICDEILECTICKRNYKITQRELEFYKKFIIPVPRNCFYCRHHNRISKRLPFISWHRECMCGKKNHLHGEGKCTTEFETSYSPDRPEIVYCEKCYQQEVL